MLVPAGVCIAVTNGGDHLRPLRAMVERAARKGTPGWSMQQQRGRSPRRMRRRSWVTRLPFVTLVPQARQSPVVIRDASVVADYVASWAGFYQDQVARPWRSIAQTGTPGGTAVDHPEATFIASGDLAAFVCR